VPGVFFCNRAINGKAPDIKDIAPTVLKLFGVDIPHYMVGEPLLPAHSERGKSGERNTLTTRFINRDEGRV
jgi:arylsulfatase A-like enzyme